jgi:hypothetical protein
MNLVDFGRSRELEESPWVLVSTQLDVLAKNRTKLDILNKNRVRLRMTLQKKRSATQRIRHADLFLRLWFLLLLGLEPGSED